MMVVSNTVFDVGDLAHVKVRCPDCRTALELPAGDPEAVKRFHARVTSSGGVRCNHCVKPRILRRLKPESGNGRYEPVNGKLALLVLGMLDAAAAKAEPDRVQVQFALAGRINDLERTT